MNYKLFLIIPPLTLISFLSVGCADKNGLSTQYDPECKESYDAVGMYKKECPHHYWMWKKLPGTEKEQCLGCK